MLKTKTESILKTDQQTKLKTNTKLLNRQTPIQELNLKQDLNLKQKIFSIQTLRQGQILQQSYRYKRIFIPDFRPPPPPPEPGTPFKLLFPSSKRWKTKLSKKRGRAGRLFDYQPSTTALIFNIRSKKKPKNVFSGMELRPIFSTSKKKGG